MDDVDSDSGGAGVVLVTLVAVVCAAEVDGCSDGDGDESEDEDEDEEPRGSVMGVMASPNWASRNKQSFENCSAGSVMAACGWRWEAKSMTGSGIADDLVSLFAFRSALWIC